MKSKTLLFFIVVITIYAITGCSSSDNPINTLTYTGEKISYDQLPVGVTDYSREGSPAGGMGALGLFSLHIDSNSISAELSSLRNPLLTDTLETVEITNFLELAPCTDCVKLKSISINSDNNIILSIGIRHPFAKGDPLKPITGRNRADLHVFNVEGIVVSNAIATQFPSSGESIADFGLVNADGYTGYLDDVLDDIFETPATIHPYIQHFDDYSIGNYDPLTPTGFASVTDPGPSGNLVMAMGCDYDFQDYIFDIKGDIDLIFAVGCTYAVSCSSMSQRFSPEYRVPQHNKKAASEVSVAIVSNDLRGGDTSSTAQIEVHVVDINHGVDVGNGLGEMLSDSSVSAISVEVPGVTSGTVNLPTTPVSGTGHDPSDPLIFSGVITNTSGAVEGNYSGLVKVLDSYSPGQNASPLLNGMDGIKRVDPKENPLTGCFAIAEFATYQAFALTIESGCTIEVISPNGGEEWAINSTRNITWQTTGYIGEVKLEYSKDNFVSDLHLISDSTPDDGAYEWPIPDDPSNTVKVRASLVSAPSMYDNSDDFFIIKESSFRVILDSPMTLNTARIDFAPSNIVRNDGQVVISYIREYADLNYTSDFVVSNDSGATWVDPPYSSWGGTPTVPRITTMALDALGDHYHKGERGGVSVFVKFTIPWPNTGLYLTRASHGIALIFTYDGYPLDFGDYNGIISMKRGLGQNAPFLSSWTEWNTLPQITVVPNPAYLSQTPAIVRDSTNAIHLAYFSSNTSGAWIRKAVNSDGSGAPWTNSDIYNGAANGYDRAREPSMRIDSHGIWHCAFILHTNSPASTESLAYVRSTNGTDWSTPVLAHSISGADILNWPSVSEVDVLGTEIIVITYSENDVIYLTFSWDGGNTWKTPTVLSSGSDRLPSMCSGLDGYVHNVWENHDAGDTVVKYIRAHFEEE